MLSSEKIMHYVNRNIKLQNKMTAVDHIVKIVEKKHVIIRGMS